MKNALLISIFLITLTSTAAQTKQTAEVNGVSIYYETFGDGYPLVLLHGFTQNHTIWYNLLDSLSLKYKLIIPDMRGHGKSTNPTNEFKHNESALDIFALLDKLNINKFNAIGYSSGGLTLLHMATQQPDRISNMVLIGTSSYYSEQARKVLSSFTFDNLNDSHLSYLRSIHLGGDEQIRKIYQQLNNFSNTYNDINFTPPYLSTITAKTLIILGDSDPLFSVAEAVDMHHAIDNSSLWIVPAHGHNLITTDKLWQQQSLHVILRFFSSSINH
ncbi:MULTISPECIES: alpha/beta fold hydrolase [unclassified Carboxylicivirga]|uniref:alpha/beta fold hydrolase n=1 Tax=Carboxylicivirga TaxID=1628153 RepID=UPI003D34AF82